MEYPTEPTASISSRSAVGDVLRLVRDMVRTAPNTASLAWALAAQNIRARYRSTFLGVLWTMLPPLGIAAGFALANRAQIFRVGDTPLPYILYVLIGTTLWQVFAEALESPHTALEQARSYITRVTFPREALIVSQFIESLIGVVIKLAIVCAFTLALGVRPGASAILLLVSFLGVLVLGYAIGLLISPLLILFSDLMHALRLLMAYGLFLAPVVYPPPKSGMFFWIVHFNPVTPLIMTARESLLGWHLSYGSSFLVLLIAAAVLLIVGLILMRVALPFLIERMLVGGR